MSSTLQPGGRLGVYEILSSLGEGGMGAVYRARDTRLKRDVAIKVLLPEVASDPERLARFQREAEVLATLNHPNIAHIYGLESQEGREGQESRDGLVGPFLVLELVEGPTLADRIAGMNGRGLPLDEALPIAKQIAEALEAAHEHGIIHRDLKPANIKVRDDGTVKVLDFGLAKAIETTGAGGAGQAGAPHADNTASPLARHALTNSPTLTSPALMTGVGMLLGTAAYMSPEQAKGKPADKRADIWAFGCVLYEMLTGRRAFDGDDATEVIASVVKSIPDWSALPDGIPSTLVKLLQRCLEKDRQARIADLSVVRYVLAEVASGDVVAGGRLASRGAGAAVDAGRPRWFVALAVASLLFVALASALATRSLSRPAQTITRIEHLIVPTASDAKAPTWAGSNQIRLTISPDGERLVYHGRSVDTSSTGRRPPLLMKLREQNEAIAIAGTEGGDGPFFSPDSRWLAFTDPVERALKRVPASGGTPQTICLLEGEFRGGAWTVDDHIVFGTTGGAGLWRVSATGGQPEHITKVDAARGELDHLWPESIPGADAVFFTAWAGSAERSRIVALSLKDGRLSTLINGGSFGRYVPTGHLLFARGGRLHAVRFDAPTLSASSDAQVVVENVAMSTYGAAQFAVASDGTLVFGSGAPGNDPKTLVWVDRQGKEEPINLPAHAYVYARLSPDGTRIALDARDEQSDIWVFDLQRETLQRLTTDPSADRGPVWTPDGKRIAFLSSRDGKLEGAYWQNADGSGPATRIDAGVRPTVPAGFVSDASRVVFMTPTGAPYDIGMFDIADPRREVMLLQSPFNENNPEVSPDGKWVAYSSNESGQNEVYVSPFPEMASAKTLVSNGGGSRPVWSRDGQELFYYGEPGTIMAVAVRPGASFSLGKAVVAVKGSYSTPALSGRHYDVSLDGKRFLLFKDVEASGAGRSGEPQIHIILNFFDELKRVAGNGH